jgi:phosphate transport system permease protein
MIFTYAVSPYEDWHRQAWAAGLVLLGLILIINIMARTILSRGIAVPR